MKQYHILACAAYPELANDYRKAAAEFPNLQLRIITGNTTDLSYYLEMQDISSFDAIVVPETIDYAHQHYLSIPIIHIEMSSTDILRTITQARKTGREIAFAAYTQHAEMIRQICDLLHYSYPVYAVNTSSDIRALLKDFNDPARLLVCSPTIAREAEKTHLVNMLLRYGLESIRHSFCSAIELLDMYDRRKDSMFLFQKLTDKSPYNIAIFNEAQAVLYTNHTLSMKEPSSPVPALRSYVPQTLEQGTIHIMKKFAYTLIMIYGKRIDIQGVPYAVFYYTRVQGNYQPSSIVHTENFDDRKAHTHSFYNQNIFTAPLNEKILRLAASGLSVLIYGQQGTGLEYIAREVYWHSSESNTPLIYINADHMTEKNWDNMVDDIHSPLYAAHYAIYFHNIHSLPFTLQKKIVDFITESNLTKRCRIISSSTRNLSDLVHSGYFSQQLFQIISSGMLTVPSLMERMDELPAFCQSLLSLYHSGQSHHIVDFEPEAYEFMKQHTWTSNFDELQSLIQQLMISSMHPYITCREVQNCIAPALNASSEAKGQPFCLEGTLDEIEARIIHRILAEENMNQSAAAKRLGIGRTTLWRKLNQ